MMKCILIGNGSSVLDKRLGTKIDSYDRIVRFNRFKIHGFENFVGTKTTDWYNTQFIENESFRFKNSYESFVFHSWAWGKFCERKESCWNFVQAKEKRTVSEETLVEMREQLNGNYLWFSTGAIAAWEMLKIFDSVHLFGFDWWDREVHHYGDNEIRGIIHKPAMEKTFFEKMGERVVFL